MPHLNIAISFIGAFCSTSLALIIPGTIQIVLEYGIRPDGPSNYLLIKNGLILVVAMFAFSTGTYESILGLVKVLAHSNSSS